MAIQLGSAYGKVSIDATGVKKGVGDAKASLKDLQGSLSTIGSTLQGVGTAMSLAFTAPFVAGMYASVKSAEESEKQLAELDAVLKSTGGVAGMTRDELIKMAAAFQSTTAFSDEQVLSAESMLLTFTKIGKNVFPQATEAVLNLGTKFGSVEQAAVQVGKALADPISGVTALRRVGVMLTDQQEEQIKKFMEVGDQASAQKIILGELETEFGGLAKAVGETSEGKLTQFNNKLDDLKEKIGAVILPVLITVVDKVGKLLDAFEKLPAPVQKGIVIIGLLGGAFLAVIGPILFLLGSIAQIASSVVGLVSVLGGAGVSFAGIGAAIGGAGAAFAAAAIPILAIVGPLLLIIGTLALVYVAFRTNFGGIRTAAEQLWFILKVGFKKMWDDINAAGDAAYARQQKATDEHTKAMQGFWQRFGDWLHTAWQNLMNWLAQMAAWGRNAIVSAFSVNWAQLGSNIISGIINGFNSGVSALVAAATNAAQAALNAIKKTLGIASPSLQMFKLGMQSAQGFALGMASGWDADQMAKVFSRPVQQTGNQQQVTVNLASGLTMQMASAMISSSEERIMENIYRVLGG